MVDKWHRTTSEQFKIMKILNKSFQRTFFFVHLLLLVCFCQPLPFYPSSQSRFSSPHLFPHLIPASWSRAAYWRGFFWGYFGATSVPWSKLQERSVLSTLEGGVMYINTLHMHTISHTNIFTSDLHVNIIDSKHLLFTKYCPENIHV